MSNEELVKSALSRVLTNVGNYPVKVQAGLWGADLSKVIGEATEAVMASGAIEKVDTVVEKPLVSRVELIVNSQREKVIYGATEVATALQDGGRTLKIFVRERD